MGGEGLESRATQMTLRSGASWDGDKDYLEGPWGTELLLTWTIFSKAVR